MNQPQATDRSRLPLAPHPRSPHRTLLYISIAALVAWISFLTLVALRVV